MADGAADNPSVPGGYRLEDQVGFHLRRARQRQTNPLQGTGFGRGLGGRVHISGVGDGLRGSGQRSPFVGLSVGYAYGVLGS